MKIDNVNSNYKPRLIDKKIERALYYAGGIIIEGPKWCGKTTTAKYHSNSYFMVQKEINNYESKAPLIKEALKGEKPRLIDEWQDIPGMLDAIRNDIDEAKKAGFYILTGSIKPNLKDNIHSGVGRFSLIKMFPLSLYELELSSGQVSLLNLFENNFERQKNVNKAFSNQEIAKLIIQGGWPKLFEFKKGDFIPEMPKDYVNLIISKEIVRLTSKNSSRNRIVLVLKSLARNDCSLVSYETLIKDTLGESKNNNELSRYLLHQYLEDIEKFYILDNIEPFNFSIKSSLKLREQPKKRFIDPSITCALLNIDWEYLVSERKTLGTLFESLALRDLRVYCNANDMELMHYHDLKNNEIDAIIRYKQTWAGIEIKLGENQTEEAAKNLLKISQKIQDSTDLKMSFLAIIVGCGDLAYQREDGIYVIPINMLKN